MARGTRLRASLRKSSMLKMSGIFPKPYAPEGRAQSAGASRLGGAHPIKS
jgi:hypothetical protein